MGDMFTDCYARPDSTEADLERKIARFEERRVRALQDAKRGLERSPWYQIMVGSAYARLPVRAQEVCEKFRKAA